MKYKASETKIYTTTDYEMFIFTDWNRNVSNSRVVKMVESIQKFGWLPEPVLVNENFEVIDGQSRVKALEALGLPVQFIIAKGIGRSECQALNLFQKNWSTKDYINSYISDGNENYIWLNEMISQYKTIPASSIMSLVASKGRAIIPNGDSAGIISEGRLELSLLDQATLSKQLFYLSRFSETINYLGGRKDTFYQAVLFLFKMDGVDNERLCTVTNNARYDGLVSSGTVEGWLAQLEELYNRNLKKINKIDAVHEYKIA